MRRRDDEAVALIDDALDAILAAGRADRGGVAGADLIEAVGSLRPKVPALLRDNILFAPLARCFTAARAAGATFAALERLRITIAGLSATTPVALFVRARCLCFCLVEQAGVLANTTFTSRDAVEATLAQIVPAFEASEETAADAKEGEVCRVLITLRAAVVRDLTARSRPLPRVVSYSFPQSLPALALANRLYGDAARATDLLAENRTVHPLFMRPTGRALSA